MEAATVLPMSDRKFALDRLVQENDDGRDPDEIAVAVYEGIPRASRKEVLLHLLAWHVRVTRNRQRHQVLGRVRRGSSRAQRVAENVEEFELFSMMVAIRGEFAQPFGDCAPQQVSALAEYYADLEVSAATEKAAYGRVLALFDAHPKAKRVRDLPYGEVERAMCDA